MSLFAGGWHSTFLLTGCTIEGRLIHFLSDWLRTGWQSVISQGKSLKIFCHGRELNQGHGEDRQ